MAAKSKAITELGTVARNGNGWRARVKVDRRNTDGPQRATHVEAQVDLDRARQKASRGEMLTFLALPKTSHLGRKLAVYPKAGWRSAKAGLRTRHPKTSHLGRKFTLCPKAGLRNLFEFTLYL